MLFRVLEQHQPDHPLLNEAYRQAMHIFLDAEEACAFLDRVQQFRWSLRELPVVSPFSFAILREQDQRKHDAGGSRRRDRTDLCRYVCAGGGGD